jgi:predicted nuclease with RNAse H fold
MIATSVTAPKIRGVLTLGIDLASQPKNTAACVIDWETARVEVLSLGWSDADLIEAMARARKTGIDAPFGWPEPFVRALAESRWPGPGESRKALERRATDRLIHRWTGKLPMSVSTDRIAYCAMRCAALIDGEPRDGSGKVVEAYPDASLRCWLAKPWPNQTYKRVAGSMRRAEIVKALRDGLGERFDWNGFEQTCVASDDCLDALVCALVARAAEQRLTRSPKLAEHRRLALFEGWIHLPRSDSLPELV